MRPGYRDDPVDGTRSQVELNIMTIQFWYLKCRMLVMGYPAGNLYRITGHDHHVDGVLCFSQ